MSQALRYISPNRLEWHEVARPTIRDARDAIVRPVASTTSDLDVPIIRGKTPFKGPFDIGHECIAEIVEIGEGARSFHRGQLVIVSWHISCGTCHRCGRGLPNTCANHPAGAMFGMAVGDEWGGFLSDLVRVPFADASLLPLPQGLDPTHLASLGDKGPVSLREGTGIRRRRTGQAGADHDRGAAIRGIARGASRAVDEAHPSSGRRSSRRRFDPGHSRPQRIDRPIDPQRQA